MPVFMCVCQKFFRHMHMHKQIFPITYCCLYLAFALIRIFFHQRYVRLPYMFPLEPVCKTEKYRRRQEKCHETFHTFKTSSIHNFK